MDYKIYQLPEAALHYPSPKVPMLPLFDPFELSVSKGKAQHSRFLCSDALFVPSGRMALYYALKLIGIGESDEVLLPAYHCGSMLEPVLYVGATPRFYPLSATLQVTQESLTASITNSTKAVLVPHFFGFSQNLEMLRNFCDQHSVALIEDCAHSFYGQPGPDQPGATGDYAITSTVKFFPGIEGGALVANNSSLKGARLLSDRPTLRSQMKSAFNTLEMAARYRRLGKFGRFLTRSSDEVSAGFRPQGMKTTTEESRALSSEDLKWFMPEQIGMKPSFSDVVIASHWKSANNMEKRRENYCYLASRFSDIPGITLLFPKLDTQTVPYILPLLIDQPELIFPVLKSRGVPIWRWEELVKTSCQVSADYRLRLIQLPCHQSLQGSELAWIADTLIETAAELVNFNSDYQEALKSEQHLQL